MSQATTAALVLFGYFFFFFMLNPGEKSPGGFLEISTADEDLCSSTQSTNKVLPKGLKPKLKPRLLNKVLSPYTAAVMEPSTLSPPRTFNPADYAEPAQTEDGYGGGSTWNNTGSAESEEGTSK